MNRAGQKVKRKNVSERVNGREVKGVQRGEDA